MATTKTTIISQLGVRPMMAIAAPFGVLLCLAACSWQPPTVAEPDKSRPVLPATGGIGERAASVALDQLGVPYRYGGESPSGFDCSGLVHYAYARAGQPLPRTTLGLYDHSRPVAERDWQVGDLLFFRIGGQVSHVGVYLGDDRFVHAPKTGRSVSIETLDSDFYRRALIGVGRP